jgi:hypothetical protein
VSVIRPRRRPLWSFCRKPGRKPCGIFTTPGAMWYGVKMCGKAYGVRSCYDGRGMCTTLPENLDHVVLGSRGFKVADYLKLRSIYNRGNIEDLLHNF